MHIKGETMGISVVDYLVRELERLGINDFFGLPGDFNFNIIEAVEKNPKTKWIGCTNELNAGYAADGYARTKGFGAIVTTYNVGELSALNAVAGSFAENVAVIQIVGMPTTKHIERNSLLHHNSCPPDYFASMSAYLHFTSASTMLTKKNTKKEIDRVITEFIKEKKPVYISIPKDICHMEIDDEPEINSPESDEKKLSKAIKHALELIDKANFPLIIGDVLTYRFKAKKEFNHFVEKSGIPTTTLIMGKGLINESSPNFIGTYLASLENPEVYETVKSSDCVISIGTIFSDFNTYRFDLPFAPSDYIEIYGNHTIIENKKYENVLMKDILKELTNQISYRAIPKIKSFPLRPTFENSYDKKLDFNYMSERFEKFFQPHDHIITDTGILNYFIPALTFPDNTKWYVQLLYASIGWATPAAFGACMANNDTRLILITGEGSHQLTVQSVSDMIFRGLTPKIFILNNSGYTIERVLSDNPFDNYNNVIPWNYTKIFEAFGGDVYTAQVRTNKELDETLNTVSEENRMCYVEMFTDKMELPYLAEKIFNFK